MTEIACFVVLLIILSYIDIPHALPLFQMLSFKETGPKDHQRHLKEDKDHLKAGNHTNEYLQHIINCIENTSNSLRIGEDLVAGMCVMHVMINMINYLMSNKMKKLRDHKLHIWAYLVCKLRIMEA
jgi:hypothetical protein